MVSILLFLLPKGGSMDDEQANDFFTCVHCDWFGEPVEADVDEATGFWNCPNCGELNGDE